MSSQKLKSNNSIFFDFRDVSTPTGIPLIVFNDRHSELQLQPFNESLKMNVMADFDDERVMQQKWSDPDILLFLIIPPGNNSYSLGTITRIIWVLLVKQGTMAS